MTKRDRGHGLDAFDGQMAFGFAEAFPAADLQGKPPQMVLLDVSDSLPIRSPGGVSGAPDGPKWHYIGQTYGMAVGDINGDGLLDLYVNHHAVDVGDLIYGFGSADPDHKFINTGDDQHGTTFYDINQDGLLDLLEARGGASDGNVDPDDPKYFNHVYMNTDGHLRIHNAAGQYDLEYGPARGRIFTPINFDGELSLFAANEEKADGSYPSVLLKMKDNGKYTEWSHLTGDLDGDRMAIGDHLGGDDSMDVITARKDQVIIHLNLGEGFSASNVIVKDYSDLGKEAVRDVQVADFNGDLRNDIFVAIGTDNSDELYTITPAGQLRDLTKGSGIDTAVFQSASATTGDFDNDGDQDIAVLHESAGVNITFWMNDGHGVFARQDYVDGSKTGIGDKIISGDFNNDGWIDFLVATGRGAGTESSADRQALGVYTMLESPGGTNNWLTLSLKGTASEVNGLGARVYVTAADGSVQMLEQDSGVHLSVQDSSWLHFGLGTNTSVQQVEVVWASGHHQVIEGIGINQNATIIEQRGHLTLHRDGDLVSVVAVGPGDQVSLSGTITARGHAITGGTATDVEGPDLVTFAPRTVTMDLHLNGNGVDAFEFHVDALANLVVAGDFDVTWV